MFSYNPHPIHAAFMAFMCILFIALGTWARGRMLAACNLGALIFAIFAVVIIALLILDSLREHVRVMTEWMDKFARLDEEGKAAVAFVFPYMRYRMRRGVVRAYFEDSPVPIEIFKLFLQTSDGKYISPERYWYTAEMPRWAWVEIKGYLEDKGYIIPNSASGSHSWMWRGESYQHLCAYWGASMNVPEIPEIDVPPTTPPLAEEVSGE